LAVPELIRVMVWELRVPTATSPKLALGGTTESCGWSGWTPMPLRAIVVGGYRALLTSETLPVMLPVLAGAKTTLKLVFCPGVRVMGKLRPPTLRPLLELLASLPVSLALPELVRVMVWVLRVPTATFPKLALGGVTESCGWSGWT